ncbi:MFS transporter [Streptomyces fuscigenes]|uniref:MFS transporter n=1 Tax=Streptomyces fuscigenes TaxID=1528880 RepID=UPI001F3D85DB|nr:YfhO family protein [Streptomyces fuscigenes]
MPTLDSVRDLVRPRPAGPGSARGPVRGRAAALAALITAVAVCAGDAVARQFPFGRHARGINDLGAQFVPFHAHLWDLLHGTAHGGLLLNWQSGYGAASLPDLGTYVTSPFALLVAFFPRDRIDLAVYVITVLKMAAAGAAMAAVLPRLTRGAAGPGLPLGAPAGRDLRDAPGAAGPLPGAPWWAAALLGATYALCGWSVVEASYNPMWLDGLIAFPLLCLVGEWARTARRPVLGPLVVALAWVANFYTAYMATLGAALVLVLRLLLERETTGGQRLRAVVRAGWRVALGVALSAPVLLPVYLGTKHAYPGSTAVFSPSPWTDVFARAMPGTYSFLSPAVFIGAGALLLVAALAFDRTVPARVRAGWVGLVVAVAVSLQWRPTSLAWHAFAIPNGSPYRETFVLAGVVVVAAWTGLAHGRPGVRPVLYGTGLTAFGTDAAGIDPSSLGVALAVNTAVIVAAQFLVLRIVERRRRTRVIALVGLVWAFAWLVAGYAGLAHAGQAVATVAFVSTYGLFGLGEALLSPTVAPLVSDLAPGSMVGQYNSAFALVKQLALAVGPAVGAPMAAGLHAPYIATFVLFSLAVTVLALRLGRRLTPAQERPALAVPSRVVAQHLPEQAAAPVPVPERVG